MDTKDAKPDLPQAALKSIATLALSLWIGGLIAIGALVAPQAFHVFRTDPVFAGHLSLQNQLAADIIGGSFRKFNRLCEASGIVLIVCLVALAMRRSFTSLQKKLGWGGVIVAAALTLSAFCLDCIVFPAMDAARAIGNDGRFNQLHVLYVQLSNVQLFGLLIVLAVLTLMSSFR